VDLPDAIGGRAARTPSFAGSEPLSPTADGRER
jgi:hypothetical protein